MPSKFDMGLVEKSKENVSKWFQPSLNYCERLRLLNLLLLKYYIVLTDLCLPTKLMNNYHVFNFSELNNIVQRRLSYWFLLPEIKKEFQ